MKDEELAALQVKPELITAASGAMGIGRCRLDATSIFAWLAAGIPLAWGVWITLSNTLLLF
jgi:hypothetical protein